MYHVGDITVQKHDADNIGTCSNCKCMSRGDIYFSTGNKDVDCGTKNAGGEFSEVKHL